jgi:cell division protein FtsN
MSKSPKSGSSGNSGSLIAGIMLGMILGLAVAGGVAWFIIKKNPASFENKEHHEAPKPEVENKMVPLPASSPATAPAPISASAPEAASAVGATKQHFEFYKVLTDKPDAVPQKNTEKQVSSTKESHATHAVQLEKPVQAGISTKEIFYVQAGSFPNEDDAEKLKAKLALMGLEAGLQTAVIPDRGTYHRVRLGPFNSSNEASKTLELLKQNGVANATQIKVQ